MTAPIAPGTAGAGMRPWEYSAFPVQVRRREQVSPGFVRITLGGPALARFAPWGLDQGIKLVLPMADGSAPEFGLLDEPTPHPREWYTRWKALPVAERNVLRTYTPSAIRPEAGEIDVDVFVHEPAGPASTWAMTCAVGDGLVLTGPDVRAGRTGYGIHYAPPRDPPQVLLVGDESSLPAIRNILAALPEGTGGDVLLELADPADALLPALPPGIALEVIGPRGPAGTALEAGVSAWGARRPHAPGEERYAWVAAESAAAARIRRRLTAELGLPRKQVAFRGYWTLGGPLTL
ncbi:siderophore-interacting protein [Brachybacterium sp. NBEC-018]|uniref:siderophore-interacting protein n=1 Tax=Brachybacterium sp. NBEC-018 TaxID=2996004 RepID=UPI0021756128|nr:siderophore-interacting protein [Brachybacterium sp. NBEC-018]UVY83933.1 siderophore-interacting protein [Brachybacterium sp. NBEC-018]